MNGFTSDAAPQSRPAATADKLVEIPQYSLIKLRNLFKANWPDHIAAYYLIDNYMTWLERVNNIKNLKIYSLDGEWRKDGTFVIIVSNLSKKNNTNLKYSYFHNTRGRLIVIIFYLFSITQDRYRLFLYTLDDSLKSLKRILNILDWSKGFDVSSVCERHLPALLDIFERKKLPIHHSFMLNFHYLPKEDAKAFDVT